MKDEETTEENLLEGLSVIKGGTAFENRCRIH